ncbi:MAG: 2,3-bisphosphoglycerate-independent phosphoglycerate mutase [Planctomycetes bacterium]|nr:2,3-bisphosphoglycerate-independent phosphoglycerate mutase [Planctomycetota bacterium]
MLEKVILVICDGLGDRPIKELGNLTPLEAAKTPNLDKLASESECGMMYSLGRGCVPGSDTSHLNILGYDYKEYYSGRGTIEVTGVGMKLQDGDVALRGNFGTVDENFVIKDRRAGRIRVVEPLTKALDGIEIDGVTFHVKPGTGHRAAIVMRGKGLSSAIIDADPHKSDVPTREVTPLDKSIEAKHTARVLNVFLKKAYEILQKHPLNEERRKKGEPAANYLLVRGAGQYREVPCFKERYSFSGCCIAGGGLYKGVAAYLGMDVIDVPGATGLPDTDLEAKFRAAINNLNKYDFVFVHVKATDSFGEDGNFAGKKAFIEKIDHAARLFLELPANTLFIITGDHSTPCELKSHSGDPVPIIFHGAGVRADKVTAFNERACTQGGLGIITGNDVMPQILNLFGRLPLTGA